MNRRSYFLAVIFILLALAAWQHWPAAGQGGTKAAPRPSALGPTTARPPARGPVSIDETHAAKALPPEERIALADPLNASGKDIQSDLRVLNDLFQAWATNFPQTGNPVGENAEIAAALAGDNPLRLALIPRYHPAINARGEICDRWGTPFRFHQLSGRRMEIRSAGPDRKFATADDALFSP